MGDRDFVKISRLMRLFGPAVLVLAVFCQLPGVESDAEELAVGPRPPWSSSNLTGSPLPPPPYQVEHVFRELPVFTEPVVLTSAPGTDRLFLVELRGKIYSFPSGSAQSGAKTDLFADLAKSLADVRRVYGLTFHPRFAENRTCFICYVLEEDQPEGTRVSRFRVTGDDPPRLIPESEEIVLTWRSGGHNGGCLKFGPDGYLYISSGDGGPAFPPDPLHSGQDVGNLRSSVLRIDVDHPTSNRRYSIPRDNPFVDLEGARGEVWAYGFRNPWKLSFDSETGELWVGDVGWELWEMIYRVEKGGNYGWSLKEGSQPVHMERRRGPTPILPPIIEHSHTESRSITGGFVYRGSRLPELKGAYVYGDYVTGKVWGLRAEGDSVTWARELVDTPLAIICFGTDHDGELYVVGYDGTIHRLVPNEVTAANENFPTRLSETGLFESVAEHRVARGVVPYRINAEPWEDEAQAERYVALPGDARLGVYDVTNVQVGTIKGKWKFPSDSVLMKTLSIEMEKGNPASRRRLETQVLHFDQDTWRAYNFIWNDEQTDAILATGEGVDRELRIKDPEAPEGIRVQTWRHASRTECILCHTTRAGSIHGFVPEQLQLEQSYGGTIANQLAALNSMGLFETPVDPAAVEAFPNPHDTSLSLDQRARAYLHVNCAHCHRRGGGGTAALDVRFENPLKSSNLLERPTQGTFGLHSALVAAPGDPYRSMLYYRVSKIGRGRMPHFGSQVIDPSGIALLHDWISSLEPAADTPKAEQGDGAYATDRQVVQWLVCRDANLRSQLLGPLLESTRASLILFRLVHDRALSETHRAELLAAVEGVTEASIRDLFESFLPEDKRVKRLGTDIRADEILALPGDIQRGRELFATSNVVQCRNCHQVKQGNTTIGKSLGPELSKIGSKYNAVQLLDTIASPSRVIDPKYLTYLVETADGRVLSGLLVERDEQNVVIQNTELKRVTIPTDDIDLLTPQQKSLMPELLLRDLTAQQVSDLIAYLQSLKE